MNTCGQSAQLPASDDDASLIEHGSENSHHVGMVYSIIILGKVSLQGKTVPC